MLYREIGKTGEKISILGFGAMRLPTLHDDYGHIDESLAIPMVRKAIDMGVNYLDTGWPYHNGNSESFCAHVMADGYRDKVKIATKSPVWDVKTFEDFDKFLDQQLANLNVEHIDFYLLHALNKTSWQPCRDNDYKTFLDQAKTSGKIKYAGFSYHDDLVLFKEIIDDYDWDFCQIQLNYMDENYQAGLEGMKYAKEKGMGVIIMEPLRGGTLSKETVPPALQTIWDQSTIKRTPAEWALKYLWHKPEVDVVLSGMSELWQVEENIRVASQSSIHSLTEAELKIIDAAKAFFIEKTVVHCTNCQYCMPCPTGVNIPENFWALNHDAQFEDFGKAEYWINSWLKEEARASNCSECGLCEKKCPQNIKIMDNLKLVHEKYGKDVEV